MQKDVKKKVLYSLLATTMLVSPQYVASGYAQTQKHNGDTSKSVPAQTMNVSRPSETVVAGQVLDEKGEPLPGVTIATNVKGLAAVTDNRGFFNLKSSARRAITNVTVSFIGMETQVIACKGQFLKITLRENASELGEVVVTGLFDHNSATFTGSASTYNVDELRKVGNQNVLKSLQNLDPSFVLDNYNINGSNPNMLSDITIRGNASFAGLQGDYQGNPNAPLFILDGFETTQQAIFDLDMNRVKSVTVLKDAAAKAIYGSKASNGVIVVETVQPEAGRLRITYTGDINIEAPDLSSYDICNAAEKLQVEYNAGRYTSTSSPSFQQQLTEQYNELQKNIARGVDTYWLSQPLRTGVGQKHSAYMEGGTNEMRYSATVSYNGITGVMKGSDRRTISGNLNLSYRYKKFIFRNSLTITSNRADNSPYGSFSDFVSANPYYSQYDSNGNISKVLGYYSQPGSNATRSITYYNPMYNATIGTKNFSKYNEYTENFYIEFRPTEELRFTGRLGYTHQDNRSDNFRPADHTYFSQYPRSDIFQNGDYTIVNGESNNLSVDLTGSYSKQFGKSLIIANAAWSLNDASSNNHGMTAWGFTNSRVDNINFAARYAENGKPSGSDTRTRSIGVTGAVNYSYDERYLADLSLRFNGSSVFGRDNRWGTFWSSGIGWNVHKEKFMENVSWVNLLKLRASYGITGNQNFNPYQAKATYTYYSNIIYDNISGAYLMALANDNLKWQQTKDMNFGLDLQLFKRLNLRAEVYSSRTTDALLAMSLPSSTGFRSYQENLGNVENNGYEVTANLRVWQKKDSYVTLLGSIAHNKNKVTKINNALKNFNSDQDANATTSPIIRYEEGQSMTAIWAVKSLGIDPATGRELFLKKDGVTTTYDYTTDDYIIAGDNNPKVHGTFGINGEVKGFGFNCLFSYEMGGDYYNQTIVDRVENVNIANNVDRRVLTSTWHEVGDIAAYKHIGVNPTTTYATTRFVERNNQLDLASVSLYYDFKHQQWLRKSFLERLRVSAFMNDVFHISTVKTERGLNYPYARTFSFSVSATF
ncbi:MAG: SusC/RagA family TonB-linked outer membrane protein [Bacteroidaceae bacterium]|nr:SusC/RagA family TonB-linked outer membrane protein [Bacteroidaceae bacterium]